MERVLIIYNPTSGKNSERLGFEDVVLTFDWYNFDVTAVKTEGIGDATKIVKENIHNSDLVVCCGGDGTFNEIATGMIQCESRIPLIYIPNGSTNDFANTIGVTKDIEEQIELYKGGSINRYDVGLFNNKYFNYVASFGVGTDSSYLTSQKMKNALGYSAYRINGFVLQLPHHIKSVHAYPMKIEYDNGVIEDSFYFGAISNTNVVAGLFKYDNLGIKLNDGKFECLFVRGVRNVPDMFKLLNKLVKQDYDGDQIVTFTTSKLKIVGLEETAWTLDGEFGGKHKNIDVDVNAGALNIVSPRSKFFD